MKKMGKNPQFVEKQQEKGDKGGRKQRRRVTKEHPLPPASFVSVVSYLPNSTLVIS
jgi:hypothetical protein